MITQPPEGKIASLALDKLMHAFPALDLLSNLSVSASDGEP